ncbi:MAG: toprim domain-containing protein [Sphingomonadaceae bacterium]|nr:toprim domain-containing protein [Sphingomonadaceae bacterium]
MSGFRDRRHAPPRLSDDEFRRLCDDAKAQVALSSIISRHTDLKKRGGHEMKGICPFHSEKSPSLEVNDAKGTYHCWGCGAAGDHFTALIKLDGLTFRRAFEALTNDTFPAVDPGERARRAAEDEAERLAAIEDARTFWAAASDIYGTPAETYLRGARGIVANLPASMRFGMVPAAKDDAGRWKRPFPALLCAVTIGEELSAIQRVFLRDDGCDKRWGKKSKLTIGRFRGGAVKMGSRRPDPAELVIAEGPEDALSLAQELPELEVWAALGTANMPLLVLPPSVQRVTIAGQNDAAGRAAVDAASRALIDRGLDVRTMWPPERFKDFNDALCGRRP